MEYKLIACDMDGTALDSKKRLTPAVKKAMTDAVAAGRHVVFSTGRNISLVKPYMLEVAGIRYAVTGSGSAVNDIETGKRIHEVNIDVETVKKLIDAARGHDVLQVMYIGDRSYCNSWAPERAGEFFVEDFAEAYEKYMLHASDVFDLYLENPVPVQKFNLLYCKQSDCREVYEKIKDLPLKFTGLMPLAMEINAAGVNKAEGLSILCDRLGITLEECITVGDGENDIEMIEAAGLGLAMENGLPEIKAAADAVIPSCDNDGVAAAIYKYLL